MAAIVVTANQVDIDAGELARMKAKSKDVKEFADLMAIDHSSVNKSAMDLAKKLDLKPEDSPPPAQTLKRGGEANIAKLKGLKGGCQPLRSRRRSCTRMHWNTPRPMASNSARP
ncbi:DUF4142 domain-containing protein [Cupriavidus gilardii]|nr:DUF4142 domain-containing protein [Cupriavidus gilardii]